MLQQMQIRPFQLPDDLPDLAALRNSVESEPITPAELGRRMAMLAPGEVVHRMAAEAEDGRVVGMTQLHRAEWEQPGRWFMTLRVLPERRGQGVGSALLETAEGICRTQGGQMLEVEVRDSDVAALAFAGHRGFHVHHHIFESTLDLAAFDESRFAGAVEATGLRFASLADVPDPEGYARRAYEMMGRALFDIPNQTMTAPQSYEAWSKWALDEALIPRDGFLMALDGDRVAGVTLLEVNRQSGAVYTMHTSVDRPYRGRGVALALKLVSVTVARRYGAPYMRTNNDATNAAMLAVNRKMGYVPAPGFYIMEKALGQGI